MVIRPSQSVEQGQRMMRHSHCDKVWWTLDSRGEEGATSHTVGPPDLIGEAREASWGQTLKLQALEWVTLQVRVMRDRLSSLRAGKVGGLSGATFRSLGVLGYRGCFPRLTGTAYGQSLSSGAHILFYPPHWYWNETWMLLCLCRKQSSKNGPSLVTRNDACSFNRVNVDRQITKQLFQSFTTGPFTSFMYLLFLAPSLLLLPTLEQRW